MSQNWLHSQNGVRADKNNFKSSSGDEFFFNNLDKLINDIKNKKNCKKKYHWTK